MKAILLCGQPELAQYLFEPFLARIEARCELVRQPCADIKALDGMRDAEVAFATWGIPILSQAQIAQSLPKLRAVFYAAGSVRHFAEPYFQRGVRVFSAWRANAHAVADFTFGQILLAAKGYFGVQQRMRASRAQALERLAHYPGSYHIRVGLLGCGAIGGLVAERMQTLDVETLVYDPFLSGEQAARLHVKTESLRKLFASCDIVSNHLANVPQTERLIGEELLSSLPPYATFINTGRGLQVDEDGLYRALRARTDLTALLDVLVSDANAASHALNTLENCFITPHMAGASGRDRQRMGEYAVCSFEKYLDGLPDENEITGDMLGRMA